MFKRKSPPSKPIQDETRQQAAFNNQSEQQDASSPLSSSPSQQVRGDQHKQMPQEQLRPARPGAAHEEETVLKPLPLMELERSDIENITNYIAYLQDKVPQHLVRAIRHEEELRNLKDKHHEAERDVIHLREELDGLKHRYEVLKQDHDTMQTRMEEERKDAEKKTDELNVSRSALAELERDYRDLKNQYDIAIDKKSYLEKLFEEKAEKLSALQVSYSEISARRNLLEIDIIEKINDLKSAQSIISDLRRENEQRKHEIGKKDEKLVTLSTDILNLKRVISDKNDHTRKQEQDYKKLFDEFHKMKSDHDVTVRNLTSKLTALEQKNAFISRRYEEMRDEYKGLKGGYASILEENKYLKAKYLNEMSAMPEEDIAPSLEELEKYGPDHYDSDAGDNRLALAYGQTEALPEEQGYDNSADDTIADNAMDAEELAFNDTHPHKHESDDSTLAHTQAESEEHHEEDDERPLPTYFHQQTDLYEVSEGDDQHGSENDDVRHEQDEQLPQAVEEDQSNEINSDQRTISRYAQQYADYSGTQHPYDDEPAEESGFEPQQRLASYRQSS
jgi:myosin heavy subunit